MNPSTALAHSKNIPQAVNSASNLASAAGIFFTAFVSKYSSIFYSERSARLRVIAHRMTLALGGIAMLILAAMFFKPAMADGLKALSPFAKPTAATALDAVDPALIAVTVTPPLRPVESAAPTMVKAPATLPAELVKTGVTDNKTVANREEQLVSQWISRRYRVANDAAKMMVSSAYQTARELKIDPLLILSVMAIESRFNPFAESPVGAQGLMQVMSKVHQDKFQPLGGVKAALNPAVNIRVGSLILKEYLKRGGSVQAALKMYVGAAALDTDFGYGEKVLAEYARLKDVATGKQVSVFATTAKAPVAKPKPLPAAEPVPSDLEPQPGQALNVDSRPAQAEPELLSS